MTGRRPVDAGERVDLFHLFVGDVGGALGGYALGENGDRREDERNRKQTQDGLFHEVSPFAGYYSPT